MENKASGAEMRSELSKLHARVEEFQEGYVKKMGAMMEVKEMEKIFEHLESKANLN